MSRVGAATACACCLALPIGCGGGSEASAWNHDPNDPRLGPPSWSEIDPSFELCLTGTRQSPVDLAAPASPGLPDLELSYPPASLRVENTGHVVEVPVPESTDSTLTIEDDEYRLLQYHFHAPSEHTLEGRSYEAEVHLVHESEEGELAVVGVLLKQSEPSSPLVDLVLESAPEGAGEEVEVGQGRSALELLGVLDASSAFVEDYYAYAGSLTTPECAEGVRWFVLESPLPVSAAATDRLHELIAGFPEYDGYEKNNRPIQPLLDRKIERSVR